LNKYGAQKSAESKKAEDARKAFNNLFGD